MEPSTTLDELQQVTDDARPADPAGNCRDAAKALATKLEDADIPHTLVQGYFRGMDVYGAQTAEHFYITVPADAITGYEGGDSVILDPTLDQFTSEHFHDGVAESYVPRSVMVDRFIVYPNDAVYDAYVAV